MLISLCIDDEMGGMHAAWKVSELEAVGSIYALEGDLPRALQHKEGKGTCILASAVSPNRMLDTEIRAEEGQY